MKKECAASLCNSWCVQYYYFHALDIRHILPITDNIQEPVLDTYKEESDAVMVPKALVLPW